MAYEGVRDAAERAKKCREANKRWRLANPEKVRESKRRHYQKHKGTHHEGYLRWYARNRVKVIERARRLRAEALIAYGSRCVCCGESHSEFLGIDHLPGYANALAPNKNGRSYNTRYRGVMEYHRLKKAGWPKEFVRMLCMNCNFATRRGKVCPHQKP